MGKLSPEQWAEIRRKYVQGVQTEAGMVFPSVRELGTAYGISHVAVVQKAKRDGWDAERLILSNKLGITPGSRPLTGRPPRVEQEAAEECVTEEVTNLPPFELPEGWADFDKNCLSLADRGLVICSQLLDNQEKMTPYYLDAVTKAIERLQKIGKVALGEMPQAAAGAQVAVINFNEININSQRGAN